MRTLKATVKAIILFAFTAIILAGVWLSGLVTGLLLQLLTYFVLIVAAVYWGIKLYRHFKKDHSDI
jgi:hypothetical protein